MIDNIQPQWLPLNKLPFFHSFVTSLLQDSNDQYNLLGVAKNKSQIIDEKLLNRVGQLFKVRQNYIYLNQEQVKRWQSEELNKKQEKQLIEIGKILERLQSVNDLAMELVHKQKLKS